MKFHIAHYIELAGQSGSIATLPGLPVADIEIDFYVDDIGNLNRALCLLAKLRKAYWGSTRISL